MNTVDRIKSILLACGQDIDTTTNQELKSWANAWAKQLKALEKLDLIPEEEVSTIEYNGVVYAHPKYVCEIDDKNKLGKIITFAEFITTESGALNWKRLIDNSITFDLFHKRWFFYQLIINNCVLMVHKDVPAKTAITMIKEDEFVKHSLFFTHRPEFMLTKDCFNIMLGAIAAPGIEGSLDKVIGGRITLEEQELMATVPITEFNYIESQDVGETIIVGGQGMPYIDSEGETSYSKSGKMVSSRLKGMYVTDPNVPANTLIVPKGAIKGKFWQFGWHLSEIHEIVHFKATKTTSSLSTGDLFFQTLADVKDIKAKVRKKMEAVQKVLNGTADLQNTLDVLNYMPRKAYLGITDRAQRMLEIGLSIKDDLLSEQLFCSHKDIREGVIRSIKQWLQTLEVEVDCLQCKAFTLDILDPGVIYVSHGVLETIKKKNLIIKENDKDVIVLGGFPREMPMLCEVQELPPQLAYRTSCWAAFGHPKTFAAIGRDGDGDLVYFLKKLDFPYALKYDDVENLRLETQARFEAYIRQKRAGQKPRDYHVEQEFGLVGHPLQDYSNQSLKFRIGTSYDGKIGFMNRLLQHVMFQQLAGDNLQDIKSLLKKWWTLFMFQQIYISAKKDPRKLIPYYKDGIMQTDIVGRALWKRVGAPEFWELAEELFGEIKRKGPTPFAESLSEWINTVAPQGLIRELFNPIVDSKSNRIIDKVVPQDIISVLKSVKQHKINVAQNTERQYSAKLGGAHLNSSIWVLKQEFGLNEFEAALIWAIRARVRPEHMTDIALTSLKEGEFRNLTFSTRAHVFIQLQQIAELMKQNGTDIVVHFEVWDNHIKSNNYTKESVAEVIREVNLVMKLIGFKAN